MNRKSLAIIVGAGTGERFGGMLPKQYQLLDGAPIFTHTLSVFLSHRNISAVLPVINPLHSAKYYSMLKAANLEGHTKLLPPVTGGSTRNLSCYEALENVLSMESEGKISLQTPRGKQHNVGSAIEIDSILIHDAARPFITSQLISTVISQISHTQAVVPVLPVVDTVKEVKANRVTTHLNRDYLVNVQTPQGFPASSLKELLPLYQSAKDVTDDSALFQQLLNVVTVPGEERNVKITTKNQLDHLNMLSKNTIIKVGQGFDVHKFATQDLKAYDVYPLWPEAEDKNLEPTPEPTPKEEFVMLGGVKIPFYTSLLGHSDADVALHALVDALLGALGLGDIGDFFPASDPRLKGCDSAVFVEKTVELLKVHKASINNVDLTIICEKPKISPYKTLIKQNIARLLQIKESMVNVKATTTEKLGFTGREEGIAALCIATLSCLV